MQAAGSARVQQGDCETVLTDPDEADTNSDGEISEAELSALTVAQLRELAGMLGITLTATRKADIIAEILDGAESIVLPTEEDSDVPTDIAGG